MIWIKIGQFVIWFVVSSILGLLFPPIIKYITDKLEEHKVAIWLSSMFIVMMIGTLGIIFTIWILTWMFFGELYLMLLLMYLTGITILAVMLWRMGVLNNKGLSRLILKEMLTVEEHPNLDILARWSFYLTSIGALVVIFYIFFIMNVSLEIMASYIIVVSYLSGSATMITQLFARIPILSSPRLDTELRIDYLAVSFYFLYILSFFIYFILWALNIPLSLTILVIGDFEIQLLFMVVLGIFALFVFFVVLPYSLGENRVKKEEIKFLEKRHELLKEIEKTVDLTDLEGLKTSLNAENEKILKESTSINEEILNKQQYYENLASLELAECLKDFFKPKLSYIDSLRRYSEHITFTLNSGTPSAYADLDKLTDNWEGSVNEELEKVKKRRPVFWKSISVASIIWVSLNTFLGVSLTDILKTLL